MTEHPWVRIKDSSLLSKLEPGKGAALDIGGGGGRLRAPLNALGYSYVNVDPAASGPGAIVGRAELLPIAAETIDIAVCHDALHHLTDPAQALREIYRALTPSARVVIWVPFMYPFHGDDRFRFTPLLLREMLVEAGFDHVSVEAPQWIFTVAGLVLSEMALRLRLRWFAKRITTLAAWLDRRLAQFQGRSMAHAAAYLVLGIK